jgi:hypothetical protein
MREVEQTQHPVREIRPFCRAVRKEQHPQEKKAALGYQLPQVAGQMIIAGLVGIPQLPAERMHLNEKERPLRKSTDFDKKSFVARVYSRAVYPDRSDRFRVLFVLIERQRERFAQ